MAGLIEKAKQYVTDAVTNMAKPEATVTDVDLKGVCFSNVTYNAKVNVSNPYSTPIPIGEIRYVLKSSGSVIATGTIPDPGSLKGNGDTMLDVEIKVPHSVLVSLVKDIAFDWDIDYELEVNLVVDLPLIGEICIPVSNKAMVNLLEEADQLVIDTVASISKPKATLTHFNLKGISFDSVNYNAKVNVSNPYITPIPTGEVHYVLKSSGRVIASGTAPDQGPLKGSGDTLLDVEVKVPHTVLISLVEDIALDWDIDYELQVNLVFDIPLIGDISIPITKTGEIKLPSIIDFFT